MRLKKYLKEGMGFVQKLDYQENKGNGKRGKKRLSPSDLDLLKSRGSKIGQASATKRYSPDNLSKTPKRQQPVVDNALVKKGDIFYNSWGYDQTNIDWYQVVEVTKTGKSVKIKRLNAKVKDSGNMTGISMPIKNSWHSQYKKVLTKRIRVSGDEVNLPMPHGWCPKWDGKPKNSSWYH